MYTNLKLYKNTVSWSGSVLSYYEISTKYNFIFFHQKLNG